MLTTLKIVLINKIHIPWFHYCQTILLCRISIFQQSFMGYTIFQWDFTIFYYPDVIKLFINYGKIDSNLFNVAIPLEWILSLYILYHIFSQISNVQALQKIWAAKFQIFG